MPRVSNNTERKCCVREAKVTVNGVPHPTPITLETQNTIIDLLEDIESKLSLSPPFSLCYIDVKGKERSISTDGEWKECKVDCWSRMVGLVGMVELRILKQKKEKVVKNLDDEKKYGKGIGGGQGKVEGRFVGRITKKKEISSVAEKKVIQTPMIDSKRNEKDLNVKQAGMHLIIKGLHTKTENKIGGELGDLSTQHREFTNQNFENRDLEEAAIRLQGITDGLTKKLGHCSEQLDEMNMKLNNRLQDLERDATQKLNGIAMKLEELNRIFDRLS